MKFLKIFSRTFFCVLGLISVLILNQNIGAFWFFGSNPENVTPGEDKVSLKYQSCRESCFDSCQSAGLLITDIETCLNEIKRVQTAYEENLKIMNQSFDDWHQKGDLSALSPYYQAFFESKKNAASNAEELKVLGKNLETKLKDFSNTNTKSIKNFDNYKNSLIDFFSNYYKNTRKTLSKELS